MSEPNLPLPPDEDARRQRLQALRDIAERQSVLPATTPGSTSGALRTQQHPRVRTPGPARRARRRPGWLIIVGAVLALVVVAAAVAHQLGIFPGRSSSSRAVPSSVVITPSLHGMGCLQDATWSPDGRQIAVVGYSAACPNDDPSSYSYQPGLLQIYSATTGHLIHTLLPDATALGLPGIPAPPSPVQPAAATADTSKPVLDYTHVLWSPDGKQLALTFDILHYNAAGTIAVPAFAGLVLLNADATNERAALVRETSGQYSGLRWDTTTLGPLAQAVQRGYDDFVSMPLGVGYSWSSEGHLIPSGTLISASSPSTAVGNPDGGSAFTIWQPGFIELFPEQGAPNIYTWYTAFLAWSPDERYLLDSFSLRGIVHPVGEPSPTAAELHLLFGLQNASPTMPIRDPAQEHLYVLLTASAANGNGAFDDIAWSPSGRILAAIPDETSSNGTGAGAGSALVTLYDSATGKTARTLQPAPIAHVSVNAGSATLYGGSTSLLRWSADGSHLLLYSDQLDTITIWGVE